MLYKVTRRDEAEKRKNTDPMPNILEDGRKKVKEKVYISEAKFPYYGYAFDAMKKMVADLLQNERIKIKEKDTFLEEGVWIFFIHYAKYR